MGQTYAGIFTTVLQLLQNALAPGIVAIRQPLLWWLGALLMLEVVRVAWGVVFHRAVAAEMFLRLLLRGGLVVWAFQNWPTLLDLLVKSGVQLGLLAGGNRITAAQFLDPGSYLQMGITAGTVLYDAAFNGASIWAPSTIPIAFGTLIAWAMLIVGYGVMGISVFIWQVEVVIAAIGCIPLLPFAVFRGTGWISQGAIAYIVNIAARFLIGALLAAIVFPVLNQIRLLEPSLDKAAVIIIVIWALMFLFLKVPAIASALLSGAPTLTAGQVAAAVAATVGTGAALGTGLLAGGLAARGAAHLAVRAGQAVRAGGAGLSAGGAAAGQLGASGAASTPPSIGSRVKAAARAIREESAPARRMAGKSFTQGLASLRESRWHADGGGGGAHGPNL